MLEASPQVSEPAAKKLEPAQKSSTSAEGNAKKPPQDAATKNAQAPANERQDTAPTAPKPAANNGIPGTGINLKDIRNGKPGKNSKKRGEELPKADTPYDNIAFLTAWKELLEQYNDNKHLYVAMRKTSPVLRDDFVIELKVENQLLKKDISERMFEIRKFLFERLNNSCITFDIRIQESEGGSKKPYTAMEKYEYLLKKNPNLSQLQKAFNLKPEL